MFNKKILLIVLFCFTVSCTAEVDPLVEFVKNLNKLEKDGRDLIYSTVKNGDALLDGAVTLGGVIKKAPAVKDVTWTIHNAGKKNYADIIAVLSDKGQLSQSIKKAISTADTVWPDGTVKAVGRSYAPVKEVVALLKKINEEVPDARIGVSLVIRIDENKKAYYDYFGAVILDKKGKVKYYEARMKDYNLTLTRMQEEINEITPDWLVWRDLRKQ